MSTISAEVHAKNTEAFINENPTEIVFERRKKESTPSGGFKWVKDRDIEAQIGRIVFSVNKSDSTSRVLPDGEVVNLYATITMRPGADVEYNDLLHDVQEGGIVRSWRVITVSHTPSWRTSVEIAENA